MHYKYKIATLSTLAVQVWQPKVGVQISKVEHFFYSCPNCSSFHICHCWKRVLSYSCIVRFECFVEDGFEMEQIWSCQKWTAFQWLTIKSKIKIYQATPELYVVSCWERPLHNILQCWLLAVPNDVFRAILNFNNHIPCSNNLASVKLTQVL